MPRTKTSLLLLLAVTALTAETFRYQKPPKQVLEALNAPLTPLISVSPQRDTAILMQPVRYPPVAEVAQPMLRLAGIRIDVETNGLHLARTYTSYAGKRLSDGADIKVTLPSPARLGNPVWSPDGKQFAFTNTTAKAIELWVANTASGAAHRINGIAVNGVLTEFSFREPIEPLSWMGDSRTLLVRTVPSERGSVPVESRVPVGPHVQESLGHAGPAPTFEDLLANPHDEDLFDYYATAQLTLVDTASGKATPYGRPAIYAVAKPSPDGQHVLVAKIHRPYSYQLPAPAFPQDVEVWGRSGSVEKQIAKLPLADRVPLSGVRTGPRSVEWLGDQSATLTWAEALDGGNPKETVPHRDRLLSYAAPFQGEPQQVFKTKERFRSLQPLTGGKVLVEDFERVKRVIRTVEIDLNNLSAEPKVLFNRNERDAYRDPGRPVLKTLADGKRVVLQSGDSIFLNGQGASPAGERPFIDRYNLAAGKADRVFQASADGYENIVAVLDDNGSRLLTRRESPTEPPNYFLRTGNETKPLTNFGSPMPQAAGVKKQLVKYKRADGVPLSFTLYTPAGYKEGARLPAVVWAYPYEFSDADTAGQLTGHDAQSFPELNYHQMVVLDGYALIDNAAMPIVGDPDTVNNTYVDQLKMDAQAAVDKAVEMGVVDRERVGVFGHSYGAFMTANLLAHTNLFKAGVAESGAYNRTLTPFGFQSERRTFWEAKDVYTKMSPFWFADKIKEPILLIHGEADDNTGTFPIQSERLYAAVRGNGGTVRLVMLPNEAHGYRGKETMEHVLFEELSWFDRYLKGKEPGGSASPTESDRAAR